MKNEMFAKNLMFILGIACGVPSQAASTIYDIRTYGAQCDNSKDDSEAIRETFRVAAGKGAVYIPASTVRGGACLVSTEIAYNVATSGPITVFGDGPNSILKASGASNKVLHFIGTAGVTIDPVVIQNLSVQSATSATSPALIHLDGIAHWLIEGVWADGKNKANNCFQMTAAQQGQVSGGQAQNCTTGAYLESKLKDNDYIRSNGIDWHGMTFINSATNFKILQGPISQTSGKPDDIGADDVFFHGNHLTNATMQIDAAAGTGMLVFSNNHLEPVSVSNSGMIIRRGIALITGNSFFGIPGSTDLNLSNALQAKVIGNVINGNVTIGASAFETMFAFNSTGGIITDSGTRTTNFGNRKYSGTPLVGSKIYDDLTINSDQKVGASMLTVKPPAIAGNWGMQVHGAGASHDIYYQFGGGAVIAGRTDNAGIINFKSAPGGTKWGSASATGVRGVMVIGTGAVGAVEAGEVGISGTSTITVGAAGTAAELPARPVGYVTINVAGKTMKIPYYNP